MQCGHGGSCLLETYKEEEIESKKGFRFGYKEEKEMKSPCICNSEFFSEKRKRQGMNIKRRKKDDGRRQV